MLQNERLHILLVSEDEVDAAAIQCSLQKNKISNDVTTVRSAMEACNALAGMGGCAPLRRPYVILLNVHLPQMNSLEFLRQLRNDPALLDSVVIVLTTSDADKDKIAAYDRQVARYLANSHLDQNSSGTVMALNTSGEVVECPLDRRSCSVG